MSAVGKTRANRNRLVGGILLLAVALACSTPRAAFAEGANGDPWITLNRGIFRFNDALDRWALEPVARGYHYVLPDRIEGWIGNFFTNLWFPVVFTNCVLQGKPHQATQSLARFMVNSTVGIAGFGDPASRLKVPAPNEDFGQTLGYWGVKAGPYLVIPLLGPSDVRDTFGRVADSAGRAWAWFVPWWVSSGTGGLEVVNTRAKYLDNVKALRETSVDYYAAVRNAYLQHRAALVEDRVGASEDYRKPQSDEDLYYPNDTEQSPK